MKTHLLRTLTILLLAVCQFSGCSKSKSPESKRAPKYEEPITGDASDPTVELKPKWKTGQRYVFELEMLHHSKSPRESRRSSESGVSMMELETTFDQTYALSVTNELRNGIHEMELEILSLQLDVAMGDEYVLNYDSESKVVTAPDTPTTDALAELIHGKLGLAISSKNKLIRSDGGRELMDKALGAKPDGRADNTLHRIFSSQNVRLMVELGGLPDKPVRIGDSWKSKRELIGSQVSGLIDLDCTFKGWQQRGNRKCALVEFSGKVAEGETSESDRRRNKNKSDGNGKLESCEVEGKLWFDPQLGMITDINVEQNATINLGNRFSKSTNAPEKKLMTTTQTISLKLLDVTSTTKLEAKN